MRILIAEDEVELARGLKFLLEKNKYTVDVVHDGAAALDSFHYASYDVVVLDTATGMNFPAGNRRCV